MTLLRALLCVLVALQAGCAQVPPAEQPASAGAAPQAPTETAPELPRQELTRQLLYEHLLAEMAVHRQEYGLAAQLYVDLARKTRDPRIARRATDVAVYARQAALAVEAATIWLQAEPDSIPARQTLASILIGSGALQDVRPHLELLLASDPERTAQVFLQMNAMLARHTDKAAVSDVTFNTEEWLLSEVFADRGETVVLEPATVRRAVAARARALQSELGLGARGRRKRTAGKA